MFLLLQPLAAIIPFVKDAGIVGPQDHLTSLPPTTPDLGNELRLRHNSSSRKSYAASIAAKRASSAQEDADRVGADRRRLHRAEAERDRYNERVHPFVGEEEDVDDLDERAEEHRQHDNARKRDSRRASVAASAMQVTDEDHDARVAQLSAAAAASREATLARQSADSRARRAAFKEVRQQWDHAKPCQYCKHVWLVSSSAGLRKKCCQGGKLCDPQLSPFLLEPLPAVLENGFFSTDFPGMSNQLNNILSLGAVGVENDKFEAGWDRIVGHHAVRLSGRTYRFLPPSNSRGGLQYFLHDGRQGDLALFGRERNVDESILMALYRNMQWDNHLCRAYAAIGTMSDRLIEELGQSPTSGEVNSIIPQLNRATAEFDVSAICMDRNTGNHYLQVRLKGSRDTAEIACTSADFEPIGYPVLFPRGETGWGGKFRVGKDENGHPCMKISFADYLASRMLMPEQSLTYEAANMELTDAQCADPYYGKFGKVCTQLDTGIEFFFPTNRFERFHRVGQTYLVDQMSRAIDYRLRWNQANEGHIFGGATRRDDEEYDPERDGRGGDGADHDLNHHPRRDVASATSAATAAPIRYGEQEGRIGRVLPTQRMSYQQGKHFHPILFSRIIFFRRSYLQSL